MPRYTKSMGVAERTLATEHILVPIRGDMKHLDSLFTLNPTASQIYRLACEGLSDEDIAMRVTEEHDVDLATAADDTLKTLAELVSMGALETAPPGDA